MRKENDCCILTCNTHIQTDNIRRILEIGIFILIVFIESVYDALSHL